MKTIQPKDCPSPDHICGDYKWDDQFSRLSIVEYLDEIPLEYRSEDDLELLERFIIRAKMHFIQLSPSWMDTNMND